MEMKIRYISVVPVAYVCMIEMDAASTPINSIEMQLN
jgi:hypothetical protein